MRILLFTYSQLNLGDNLFIYTLSEKFSNIQFYMHSNNDEYIEVFKGKKNIKIIREEKILDNINVNDFDAFIYIGGSIFMESEWSFFENREFNKFITRCKEKGKKFYYMSSNFGPYKTKEYLELVKENFKIADGVFLRDKESYKIFSNMKNVEYAPDVVFNYDVPKVKKDKKTIGISIISLEIRNDLNEKIESYRRLIKDTIISFAKKGYKIYLFGFCESEGDGDEIDNVYNEIPKEYQSQVKKVIYKNNIEDFLDKYSKVKYMIATRFHSMVLSSLYRQKIYNITYSAKSDNVIKELKLAKEYLRIRDIDENTIIKKGYFKSVPKFRMNKIINKAKKPLEDLNFNINMI